MRLGGSKRRRQSGHANSPYSLEDEGAVSAMVRAFIEMVKGLLIRDAMEIEAQGWFDTYTISKKVHPTVL
ncbi:unnamed protein product [Haemonchus placei]|uniref:Uncharacterized protein n=1 Tax=Haemonchus placei TaxID=6290 RepID=A0A0N4W4Q3_HAEPC|nr:unnamed protein product [Haemonchus placei]